MSIQTKSQHADGEIRFELNNNAVVTGFVRYIMGRSGISFQGVISSVSADKDLYFLELDLDVHIYLTDLGMQVDLNVEANFETQGLMDCGRVHLDQRSLGLTATLFAAAKTLQDDLERTLCQFNKKRAAMKDKDLTSLVNGLAACILVGHMHHRGDMAALGVLALQQSGRKDLAIRVLADQRVQKELKAESLDRHSFRYTLSKDLIN